MTLQIDAPELSGRETKKMATGSLAAKVLGYLTIYVGANRLGHLFDSSATYNFQDEQPKRQPDVSFVSLAKIAVPPEGELTVAPDLAVEVVSKNDTVYEVQQKAAQYQAAGVRLIWIVYPFTKTIDVYRLATGLLPKAVGLSGRLEDEEILPGFQLAVSKIFELLVQVREEHK